VGARCSGALSIKPLEGSRPWLRRTRALCRFNSVNEWCRGAPELCRRAQQMTAGASELAMGKKYWGGSTGRSRKKRFVRWQGAKRLSAPRHAKDSSWREPFRKIEHAVAIVAVSHERMLYRMEEAPPAAALDQAVVSRVLIKYRGIRKVLEEPERGLIGKTVLAICNGASENLLFGAGGAPGHTALVGFGCPLDDAACQAAGVYRTAGTEGDLITKHFGIRDRHVLAV